ncbi:hypothetical protein BGZ65_003789, partial [Modicella reniformis]
MDCLLALTHLVLNVRGKFPLQDHLRLLEGGQRLEKLHLSIDLSPYESQNLSEKELEMYQHRISTIKAENSKIKDLCLNTVYFPTVMVDYLQRCPRLERLILRTLSVVHARVDLSQVIQGYCPKLKHLDIWSLSMKNTTQALLLSACSPSETTTTTHGDDRSGLESLKLRLQSDSIDNVLRGILNHKTTLTSLNFSQGRGVTPPGLQLIVGGCMHLKTLIILLHFSDPLSIRMDVVEKEYWNCRHLRTFSVIFNDYCTSIGRDSAVSLEQLYKLKRLRVFEFSKEGASMLDEHHVKTMLEQWPKLEQLG